jgi:hypothetical protein
MLQKIQLVFAKHVKKIITALREEDQQNHMDFKVLVRIHAVMDLYVNQE